MSLRGHVLMPRSQPSVGLQGCVLEWRAGALRGAGCSTDGVLGSCKEAVSYNGCHEVAICSYQCPEE